jgi:hypothetical protein
VAPAASVDAPPATSGGAPFERSGWLAARYRPAVLAGACALVALAAGLLVPTRPKEGLAVLAGAAVVAAVLLRPVIGGLLLVAVVPVTSGLATGFPVAHVRLSEALVGVVGLTLVVFVRRTEAVPWRTLDWVLLGYGLCWAGMGVLADRSLGEHLTLDLWGTVVGQLQFLLIYRGVRIAVRTPAERRLALGTLVFASVPVAALAVLEEAKAPGVASLLHHLTGGLTGGSLGDARSGALLRVTGPFVNWAALAGYLLPVVLVVLALLVSRRDLPHRRWFVAAGALGAVALALTLEQSAIVCLAVGVVVLVRRYDTDGRMLRWVVVGIALVALAAGPFLLARLVHELGGSAGTGRIGWVPQTVSFRWSVWTRQYLPAIGARPLTGYGVVLPSSIHWPWPESQYVSFLVEGGVPMLAAFGVLAWAMADAARAATRRADPVERAVGLAALIAVVSMVVMDAMWPFLSNGGMPQVLWALLALTAPLAGWTRAPGRPAGAPARGVPAGTCVVPARR